MTFSEWLRQRGSIDDPDYLFVYADLYEQWMREQKAECEHGPYWWTRIYGWLAREAGIQPLPERVW